MMVVATMFSHQVVFSSYYCNFLLKALFVCFFVFVFVFCFVFVFFFGCALVLKFQSMVSMFYILLWFEEYFFNDYIYIKKKKDYWCWHCRIQQVMDYRAPLCTNLLIYCLVCYPLIQWHPWYPCFMRYKTMQKSLTS